MRKILFAIVVYTCMLSCTDKEQSHNYNSVTVQTVFEDSVSIRAIEFLDDKTLAFAGSTGIYGTVDVNSGKVRTNQMKYHTSIPEFRAVAHTATDFFMLSAGNPALLYKTGDDGNMELVYMEEGEGVFYDAMKFWNNQEGIAVGDTMGGCLSIIITRDGGNTWKKLSCTQLPKSASGEGAFAASNTNIEIIGDQTWIATTEGRIFHTSDKGISWAVKKTPSIHKKEAEGLFSLDFYDDQRGFAIGGDYTNPEGALANKITTSDGGQTWRLIADGIPPGYKSCIQYVPNSGAADLVAIGFTGISYSNNGGESWRELGEEGFYTLQFLNDSVAYAAGRNRIARLDFKK